MTGSPLTDLQNRYSAAPHLDDLSVGYPRFTPLAEQWQKFKGIVERIDRKAASHDEAIGNLKATVGSMLAMPPDVESEVTFSGSIALERTIAALIPEDRDTIVTVPGFDSINSFVERSSRRMPSYLELDPFRSRAANVDKLLEAITEPVGAVVLVSPNNPSGLVLSPTEMTQVADACAAVNAVLIVDHCFLLIRPPDCDAGTVFGLGDKCRWAGLWDSSKTVELLGERFGLIASSPEEMARIRTSLGEIQLDLPLGSFVVLSAALAELLDGSELSHLNKLIRDNYVLLQEACQLAGLKINRPDAGSFALIEVEKAAEMDSDAVSENLVREYAIVVIPSRVLYPAGWIPERQFLRVSLARPTALIGRLCDALITLRLTVRHDT